MQQDNESKHRSKSTMEWLQKKKNNPTFWSGPIRSRSHPDVSELQHFWKEEWSRTPEQWAPLMQRCWKSWQKCLLLNELHPATSIIQKCECLMNVFNKDTRNYKIVCYQLKHIVFVWYCVLDDQIWFYVKLMRKTSSLKAKRIHKDCV